MAPRLRVGEHVVEVVVGVVQRGGAHELDDGALACASCAPRAWCSGKTSLILLAAS